MAWGTVLVLLVLGGGLLELGPPGPTGRLDGGALVLAAVAAAAVACRRRFPVPALIVTNAATTVWFLLDYHGRLITLAPLHGIRVVAGGEELLSPGLTRRLLDRVPAAGARPDDEVFAKLTTREREIVALVAQGLSNADISRELVISPATTKTHVSRALTKLGARDRAHLVALAYQHGLVDPG
jgi:DNA-binding CsgD family transcriptional regulator